MREITGQKRPRPLRKRGGDFIIAISYGDRPEFDVVLASVNGLAENTIDQEGNGAC
jgi:hypothetical protein